MNSEKHSNEFSKLLKDKNEGAKIISHEILNKKPPRQSKLCSYLISLYNDLLLIMTIILLIIPLMYLLYIINYRTYHNFLEVY